MVVGKDGVGNILVKTAHESYLWLRDYITAVKAGRIHPFSFIERKAREATRDEPWGPTGPLLNELAEASFNFQEAQIIFAVLHLRLHRTDASPEKWRNTYKALQALEYLVKRGSEHCIALAQAELVDRVRQLQNFEYLGPDGRDYGINVRVRSQAVHALLTDGASLAEQRQLLAAKAREYRGYSRAQMEGSGGGCSRPPPSAAAFAAPSTPPRDARPDASTTSTVRDPYAASRGGNDGGGGGGANAPAGGWRNAGETKGVTLEQNKAQLAALRLLLQRGENRRCADCQSADPAARPSWASINTGVFICMRCAGVHRGLGAHISKVRSCSLDTWLPEQVAFMGRTGNAVANSFWEAALGPGEPRPPRDSLDFERFVRRKYIDRVWARGSWPPEEHSAAEQHGGSSSAAAAVVGAAAPPRLSPAAFTRAPLAPAPGAGPSLPPPPPQQPQPAADGAAAAWGFEDDAFGSSEWRPGQWATGLATQPTGGSIIVTREISLLDDDDYHSTPPAGSPNRLVGIEEGSPWDAASDAAELLQVTGAPTLLQVTGRPPSASATASDAAPATRALAARPAAVAAAAAPPPPPASSPAPTLDILEEPLRSNRGPSAGPSAAAAATAAADGARPSAAANLLDLLSLTPAPAAPSPLDLVDADAADPFAASLAVALDAVALADATAPAAGLPPAPDANSASGVVAAVQAVGRGASLAQVAPQGAMHAARAAADAPLMATVAASAAATMPPGASSRSAKGGPAAKAPTGGASPSVTVSPAAGPLTLGLQQKRLIPATPGYATSSPSMLSR